MIDEWEYHVAECETGRYFDAFLELHLKPLGSDGWELVHVTERNCGGQESVSLKGYFKRRKRQATPATVAQIEAQVKQVRREYEDREKYACKVCGAVPDEDGMIEHGRGCFVASEDGGGFTFVEFDREGK